MKTFLFLNVLIVAAAAFKNSGIRPNEDLPEHHKDHKAGVTRNEGAFAALEQRDPMDSIVHVKRETNGDRFRRGETPMRPTKRKSALKPRSSPAPACAAVSNIEGRIGVYNVIGGTLRGYIRKTFDGQNSYTYGALTDALTVKLPLNVQNNVFTEFTATNGPDAGHPFVGAVGGSGGYNFNTGQLGYAYLAGTGHTAANSPPSTTAGTSIQSLGYNGPAESTIWKINCVTLAISAQWTNADGSQPLTTFFYDPPVDFVGLMGDFNKFTTTFAGEGAVQVNLRFIPLP